MALFFFCFVNKVRIQISKIIETYNDLRAGLGRWPDGKQPSGTVGTNLARTMGAGPNLRMERKGMHREPDYCMNHQRK